MKPDLTRLANELRQELASGRVVVVSGVCEVFYEGRSRSRLGPAPRLVIIKPDGSVLVHSGRGVEPVNWQPPGSKVVVTSGEDGVVIRSSRESPREVLVIKLVNLVFHTSARLDPHDEKLLHVDEHELYEVIWENPGLIEEGLRLLARQRKAGEGRADFIGVDRNGRRVVVEVKRVAADEGSVKQIYKYRVSLKGGRALLLAPRFTQSAQRLAKHLGVELKKIDVKRLSDEVFRKQKKRLSGQATLVG